MGTHNWKAVIRYILKMPSTKSNTPMKLTYFAIDGLAVFARIACVVGGIKLEDDIVTHESWAERKGSMKFGSVPNLQHGDININQSMAIVNYIGRMTGLYPEKQQVVAEEVMGLFDDVKTAMWPLGYGGAKNGIKLSMTPAERKEYKDNVTNNQIKKLLTFVEGLVSKSKTGYMFETKKPSTTDIIIAYGVVNTVHQNYFVTEDALKELYPGVAAIREKIEALPDVIAYRKQFEEKYESSKITEGYRAMMETYNIEKTA